MLSRKSEYHENLNATATTYQITEAGNVMEINLNAKNIATLWNWTTESKTWPKIGIPNFKRSQTKFLQQPKNIV